MRSRSLILITGSKAYSRLSLLTGVLLDPITEAAYRNGVFEAFLASNCQRKILCEKPIYEGGHGVTPDGRAVGVLQSQLFGRCEYAYNPPTDLDLVTGIVENRIELLTSSDVEDVTFPAFLSPECINAPDVTKVVVHVEVTSARDLPEACIFAAKDDSLLSEIEGQSLIRPGIVLPVEYVAPEGRFKAALQLRLQIAATTFEAAMYHEDGQPKPKPGNLLERKVAGKTHLNPRESVEYSRSVGTVCSVKSD